MLGNATNKIVASSEAMKTATPVHANVRQGLASISAPPAAAQGLVDRDQGNGDAPLALHELVLGGVHRALRVEYREETFQSAGIPLRGELEGATIRRHRRAQRLATSDLSSMRRERILDFFQRDEDRPLILEKRLLLAGLLDVDVPDDSSPGE